MIRASFALLLVVVTVVTAVGVVLARHDHRAAFVELTRLEHERDELGIEFGRLQLEQATLAEAARVETIARTRLGMRPPDAAQMRVVRP